MSVTPRLIFWHDLRAAGRAMLNLLGAFMVWFIQGLFFWALFSVFLGWGELTPRVLFVCAGIPTYLLARSLYKMNLPKRSWRDALPSYQSMSGLGIARLMASRGAVSSGAGESALVLIFTAAPRMVLAVLDEVSHLMSPSSEECKRLEKVRENLAARDSWEVLQDFKEREPEIRKLAGLGLVTVREISGIWSLRISLKGQRV